MPPSKIFLRITNNGEKIYAEKLGRFFSDLFFRGNFFEASPGMISTIAIKSAASKIGYAIDPMTYVFALDPNADTLRSWRKVPKDDAAKELRTDLRLSARAVLAVNLTRTIQRPGKRDSGKVEIWGMRQSFRSLADKTLGQLADSVGNAALSPDNFSEPIQSRQLVESVIDYQLSAIKSSLDDNRKKPFAEMLPVPSFVFSPYFCITNDAGLTVQQNLWREFDGQFTGPSATLMLCTTLSGISNLGPKMVAAIANARSANVAVWVENFDEEDDAQNIAPYGNFLRDLLGTGKSIINMYGSGYSMLLASRGLSSVISCGHGESKQIEPLSGGYPVSKYYIPTLRSRRGITETVNLLRNANLGADRDAFFREVCSCAICKEAIQTSASDLIASFGELGDPKQTRRGPVQFPTGQALERCKFHYLLNRIKEHRRFSKMTPEQAEKALETDMHVWAPIPNAGAHLGQWLRVGV